MPSHSGWNLCRCLLHGYFQGVLSLTFLYSRMRIQARYGDVGEAVAVSM